MFDMIVMKVPIGEWKLQSKQDAIRCIYMEIVNNICFFVFVLHTFSVIFQLEK